MSIRSRLLALALAIVLPGLLGALWGLHALYQQQTQVASRNLSEIARAVASVVEKELARKETTLKTLAMSPAFEHGDMTAFYEFARAAAPSADRVVVLTDVDGQMQLNTRMPLGAPLPRSRAFAQLGGDAQPDAALVSDLYFAPLGKKLSYALRIPVIRGGRVVGYLSMGSFAATLQKALEDQRLPKGWNASVIDRKHVIIARRLHPEAFVGKPVTADLTAQLRERREGVFETVRLDGVKTFTAYTPIAETGWTFVVSMPKSELDTQIVSALNLTILVTAVLLVLAMLAATYVGLTISRPLQQLVNLAAAMGRGEKIGAPRHGLLETRLVANELQQASERIASAKDVMAKRVEEAVDESRRAQEALLQNQKLEALGKLTGGIAHDFNNLLQTISAAIEVALRVRDPAAVKNAMESGKRAVVRATKLTRQLTTFGRGAVSAPALLDLRTHISEFRDLIEGALRGDIELEFVMPPALWAVYVDPVQLELAMLNAALNARDAMLEGGALAIVASNETVDAGSAIGLPEGEYVRIAIRDAGAGIPAADLPRVFEPFFTTKDVGKGSGLGLAQIYGFAKQSGGTATIESTPGQGTTLCLFLPRSHRKDVPPAAPVPRREEEEGGPCTVLFVEDDQLVSEVMVPGLRASGFTVIAAEDAVSALAALRTHDIDVVLSDIVMPGQGDGLYLAKEMRLTRPDVPIVLATGYSDALTATSSFRVLLKPYTLEDARAALYGEIRKVKGSAVSG
ncbi:MAG TPA: ATP-binding protein [Burkholderiales bacterium]|nr:ATP-binding protein [Burkholderiales bacterium]